MRRGYSNAVGANRLPLDGDELANEIENLRVAEEDLAQKAEELTHVQLAVEQERQAFEDLFQFAPDAYIVSDSLTVVRNANQTASVLLNVGGQYLRGKVLTAFVAREHCGALWRHLQPLKECPGRVEIELRLMPRNAPPREVVCTISSAREADGASLRWLIRDVTQQKQLQRERDQAMALNIDRARRAAILEERNRMAQELHDTLAQSFTGIRMQLEVVDELLATEPEEARAYVMRASEVARQGILDVRRAIQALRAVDLEGSDLPTAFVRLCERATQDTGMRVEAVISGKPVSLPAGVESDLFRIGQEALTNAGRHAEAEEVTLTLAYSPTQVELKIRDNGKGFDPEAVRQGFGLWGMRERAVRLGGRCTVEPAEGGGTEIRITLAIAPPAITPI